MASANRPDPGQSEVSSRKWETEARQAPERDPRSPRLRRGKDSRHYPPSLKLRRGKQRIAHSCIVSGL